MSEIRKYVLVTLDNTYLDTLYDTFDEARDAALRDSEPCAVVCLIYTFDDSELLWTPDGGSIWPPAPTDNE